MLYTIEPRARGLAARFFDQNGNEYAATIGVDPGRCSVELAGDLAEAAARVDVVLTRRNHVAIDGGALSVDRAEYQRLKGESISTSVVPAADGPQASLKRTAPDPQRIVVSSLDTMGVVRADVIVDGKTGCIRDVIGVSAGTSSMSACQFVDLMRVLREFRFETGTSGEVRTVLTLDFGSE